MYRALMSQGGIGVLLGLWSTGCMAIGSVQTAQTLGKGNFEVSIEPGAYGAAVAGINQTFVSTNVGFRFGITDRFDIGGRVGTTLGELQTKILLTDPDNENFALSLAPAIGGFGAGTGDASFGVLNIPLPVLIGFKFGAHELTLGPRVQNLVVFGSASAGSTSASATTYVLMVGGSLGFAAQLGERFRLLPEVAIASPVIGAASASAGGTSSSGSGFINQAGAIIYMANLGFQIGSPRRKPKQPEPTRPMGPAVGPYPPPPPMNPPPPALDAPPPPPLDAPPPPPPPQ